MAYNTEFFVLPNKKINNWFYVNEIMKYIVILS